MPVFALWSAPRSRSTAFFRSMLERGDLLALHETLEGLHGSRVVDQVDEGLAHELSDCLWSVLVLARRLDVDLGAAFAATMDDLETRLSRTGGA